MGGFYALHDGESPEVAEAIATHYQPRGASDDVAPGALGAALALADRVDTLVGCLGVKLRPTGSEDPFGLRRIAIGVLRTLLHHRARISLSDLAGFAFDVFEAEAGAMIATARKEGLTRDVVVASVTDFCNERLKGLLEERFSRDAIAACMAARRDVPVDVDERAEALGVFWRTPAAEDLAVAFKRVFKISREAPAGELTDEDLARLTEPAERALLEAFSRARVEMDALFAARRYTEALELIARSLRAPVDRLFTEVFVMAEDPALRASRLRLLGRIADAVGGFARFDALD
jgi:glycyl-tRNA synthetase beta chain